MRHAWNRYKELFDNPPEGVRLRPNADLTNSTKMRTKAVAAVLAEASHPAGLRDLVMRAAEHEWPLMMLGGGANTLFATSYFNGIVVTLGQPFNEVTRVDANTISAGAAVTLTKLMSSSRDYGLMGLEFLKGIPGKVGGSLAGNAGAGGWGLCDLAERVVCLTRSGRIVEAYRGDFEYGYRHSELKKAIILFAEFRLRPRIDSEAEAMEAMYWSKKVGQPYDARSCGCIFKNPVDPQTRKAVSAGWLIDQAQLKNYGIRDALVSEGHANFIINRNNATGEDFLALINMIQDVIRERNGINLHLEVNVVGGPLSNVVLNKNW